MVPAASHHRRCATSVTLLAVLGLFASACGSEATPPPSPPAPPPAASPSPIPSAAPPAPPAAEVLDTSLLADAGPSTALRLFHRNDDQHGDTIAGAGTPPPRIQPSVGIGTPQGTGEVSTLHRMVSRLRAGFMRCYVHALYADPDIQGSVAIDAKTDKEGRLMHVSLKAAKGIPTSLMKCLNETIRHTDFGAAQGAEGSLTVPVEFVRSRE